MPAWPGQSSPNRDPGLAERQAETLRAAGYEVELCGDPLQDPCPAIKSLPCPLVDRADVLIYDALIADSDGGRQLVAELRETYVDPPVVLGTEPWTWSRPTARTGSLRSSATRRPGSW